MVVSWAVPKERSCDRAMKQMAILAKGKLVSAQARPGLGVPISWEQLPSLKSGAQWTATPFTQTPTAKADCTLRQKAGSWGANGLIGPALH